MWYIYTTLGVDEFMNLYGLYVYLDLPLLRGVFMDDG